MMRAELKKLFAQENVFRMNMREIKNIKFKLLKLSFTHHFNNNPVYREYCKSQGITPKEIKEYKDLTKIPLIPSDYFKELSKREDFEEYIKYFISCKPSEIVTYFTTSGTTGKPSKYPFDKESLLNLTPSNIKIFKEVGKIGEKDKIIFLTPHPAKTATGMVQGMYLTMKNYVGENNLVFAIDERFDAENIVRKIEKEKGSQIRHLYGPPFMYNELCDYMLEKGIVIPLEEKSKAFETGGWKRYAKGEVPRKELDKKIAKCFKIKEENIRDGLGLTDIFSILLECEYHEKHVPPWIHVSIRDPENLQEEVATGEEGLIAYMTPLITSYPAYVITGDIGREKVSQDEYCECGRVGNTVEHRRRAKGTPARGCALVLDEILSRMAKKV